MSEFISRQALIDITDRETHTTKPSSFTANEKFIQYMNDPDISSFGNWQFNNGYNTALVTVKVETDKLPSIKQTHAHWIKIKHPRGNVYWSEKCSICGKIIELQNYNFCPNCGAIMNEEAQKS